MHKAIVKKQKNGQNSTKVKFFIQKSGSKIIRKFDKLFARIHDLKKLKSSFTKFFKNTIKF